MKKFSNIKEKFNFYWSQRKYNLSIFGNSAHRDWHIILIIVFGAFILSGVYSYINYKKIIAEINTESEILPEKSKKKELEKVGEFVETLKQNEQKYSDLIGGPAE